MIINYLLFILVLICILGLIYFVFNSLCDILTALIKVVINFIKN